MAKNKEELTMVEQTEIVNQENVTIDEKTTQSDTSVEQRERTLEKQIEKEEKTMKQKLAAEKKVPIFIPEDPLNPNDVVPVGVNGVIYAIPRGQEFMVPKSIYDTWMYSYKKTMDAQRKIDVRKIDQEVQILD